MLDLWMSPSDALRSEEAALNELEPKRTRSFLREIVWAEDKRRYQRGQRNIFDTPGPARRGDISPVVLDAAAIAGVRLPR